MTKTYPVPDQLKLFSELLSPFKVWLCGGAVRDMIMDKEPNDLDFCTDALPDNIINTVSRWGYTVIPTGLQHGTVTVVVGNDSYEITTLRKDTNTDGRHAEVEFTSSLQEDAQRRDFTINAMYIDPEGNLIDFFGGHKDILEENVRFVGNPTDRIKEDHLRMLRYFRMVCKFENTHISFGAASYSCMENRALLKNISVERIWSEIVKTAKDNPENFPNFLAHLDIYGFSAIIGLPSYNSRVCVMDSQYVRNFPECAVATQFDSLINFLVFMDKYKVSNIEKDYGKIFWQHTIGKEHDEELLQPKDLQILANEYYPKTLIRAIADYTYDGFLYEYAQRCEYIQFPVSGDDLLLKGYQQGRELGDILKLLKKFWENDGFKMTKEELLSKLDG